MRRIGLYLLLILIGAGRPPAQATPPQGTDETGQTENLPWFKWDYATGEWWGNRPMWSQNGVDLTATYTAQVWANVAGGLEQNAAYIGLLQFGVDIDLEKAIGWKGGSFNTTWIWISGDQPTPMFIGANFAVGGLEAAAGFRALDLWLQQDLFDEKLTLRAGMFNVDRDFTLSEYAGLFFNSAFGWPIIYEGKNGGPPAYPYAAPGFYAAWRPSEGWMFQSAVMQGDSYPQDANFYWHFDRMGGLLFLNEAIYSWKKARLPGTAKLGAMFTTGYPNIPDNSGRTAWGGSFYYGILDQALYVEPGSTEDTPQGLGCFVRGGFAAPQRSSPMGMLLETGFSYSGPIPGRDNDSVGLAFYWDKDSPEEASSLAGSNRGTEMVFEATYQIQLTPWFTVQPDVQYIIQPGGSMAIPNAFVLGLSVDIDF